jgi:aerobic-type carbon monoxide dehydrogenase small subunit (CoxS/CutS family)
MADERVGRRARSRADERPTQAGGSDDTAVSRRAFLLGASGGVVAAGLTNALLSSEAAATVATVQDAAETLSGKISLTLTLNGKRQALQVTPQTTLLSALRHHLAEPLTGTKEVCDQGTCGACTVLIDDVPAYACLSLAVDMADRSVRTVEGEGSPDNLSPVQQAFCDRDALMCGFCTPGFIMATTACLERHKAPDLATVKRELSGNLCRCGTYPHIFDAALDAAGKQGGRR